MGVKIQYNPSTGKVSFNPVTGKVQVLNFIRPFEECEFCSDGIGNVHWVTEGLIACCDGGGGVSRSLIGPWSSYLNTDIILDDLTVECFALKKIITPAGTLFRRQCSSNDCTGSCSDSEVTAVGYTVQVEQNSITCAIRAFFGGGGGGDPSSLIIFRKEFVEAGTWNCISDHDGEVPLQVDCNNVGFLSLPVDGSSGSLTIEDSLV